MDFFASIEECIFQTKFSKETLARLWWSSRRDQMPTAVARRIYNILKTADSDDEHDVEDAVPNCYGNLFPCVLQHLYNILEIANRDSKHTIEYIAQSSYGSLYPCIKIPIKKIVSYYDAAEKDLRCHDCACNIAKAAHRVKAAWKLLSSFNTYFKTFIFTSDPVFKAAFDGDNATVARFKTNLQDRVTGCTPLHAAVFQDNLSIVKTLLKAGADPSVCDELGATPLHLAAQISTPEIVAALLDVQPSNYNADNAFDYPIHSAVIRCNKNIALQLRPIGPLNATDSLGFTPISLVNLFYGKCFEDGCKRKREGAIYVAPMKGTDSVDCFSETDPETTPSCPSNNPWAERLMERPSRDTNLVK